MAEPVNYMDLAAFRERGYLQEANRQFFHPLGLALEWTSGLTRDAVEKMLAARGVRFGHDAIDNVMAFVFAAGLDKPHLSGVWDYRDDPEGMSYGDGVIDPVKAERFNREWAEKADVRRARLGYIIQPVAVPSEATEQEPTGP